MAKFFGKVENAMEIIFVFPYQKLAENHDLTTLSINSCYLHAEVLLLTDFVLRI